SRLPLYGARGRRLGTVSLGQRPESPQATLTAALTALVTAVRRRWQGPLPRLVYVTDKGQAQDDYYRRVLRRQRHPRQPGQRLAWGGGLDLFHGCGYVAKLREALFAGGGDHRDARVRHWPRHRPQGAAQALR